jgi:hypothetical protein
VARARDCATIFKARGFRGLGGRNISVARQGYNFDRLRPRVSDVLNYSFFVTAFLSLSFDAWKAIRSERDDPDEPVIDTLRALLCETTPVVKDKWLLRRFVRVEEVASLDPDNEPPTYT